MALIEFNDDVGGRHPWEVLNTQRSEVKTPYCKVVVYERPRPNRNINIILSNYICCIDCRIGLITINYLVILDIHRCKIIKDYRKRKATCLLLLIGNERWTRCSSPTTLIFRSSDSFITQGRIQGGGGGAPDAPPP